jgi:hypothetical protein
MKGMWSLISNSLKLVVLWFSRKDSEEVRNNEKAKRESDLQDDAEKAVKEKDEKNIRDLLS